MRIDAGQFARSLELDTLCGAGRAGIEFTTPDVNRPGLALAGFFGHFAADRVQAIGRHETAYLETLGEGRRLAAIDALMARPFPCLIVCHGVEPPIGLVRSAERHARPVFAAALPTCVLISRVSAYLGRALAPRESLHGVLVDVYGVGVLLTGESGTGKSEAALELLRRGHRLVADDLVDIVNVNGALTGSAPENIRHFMEIRGIGIINVRHMYGAGSVLSEKGIDMVCRLETWDASRQYERLGLSDDTTEILGVRLPTLTIPVIPGRNLAIIVEVAARSRRLKDLGYNAAEELQRIISEGDG